MDAKSPAKAGQTEFFEIKDRKIVDKVFELCQKHRNTLTVWVKSHPQKKFETTVEDFHIGGGIFYLKNPAAVEGSEYADLLKESGSNEMLGTFLFEKNHFFFKAKLEEKNSFNLLKMVTPESLFKLQRRKDIRIYLDRKTAPKLTFINPSSKHTNASIEEMLTKESVSLDDLVKRDILWAFRVLDLSTGGVSFASPIEKKAAFQAGQNLTDMKFKLQGKEYCLSGIIRHIRETQSDQGKPMLKVGVQFVDVRPSQERSLVEWVLEESRGLFAFLTDTPSQTKK